VRTGGFWPFLPIVQDIVVVLVMIGLTALGEAGDATGLGREAIEVLVKGGLFITVIGLLMRYVLTPLLHQLARSPELLVLFAIAWAVALGAVGAILLKDTAFLSEKDAEWENRKHERKGLVPVEPLYTIRDADNSLGQFNNLEYDQTTTILPEVTLRLSDADHILGSPIIELWLDSGREACKLVFSGDLGRSGMPVL
jgi:hypothetical protein